MIALTYFAAAGDSCNLGGSSSFLGFPHWYEYLQGVKNGGHCSPQLLGINDAWLIVAAVIEILLRVAALAAVGFVIYGGVQYMTSQGNPDETTKARGTLINALVGLLIAVTAAVFIQFVAGRFNGA